MDSYPLRDIPSGHPYRAFLFMCRYRDYVSSQSYLQRGFSSIVPFSHDFVYPLCFFTPVCDLQVLNLHHSKKHLYPPGRLL